MAPAAFLSTMIHAHVPGSGGKGEATLVDRLQPGSAECHPTGRKHLHGMMTCAMYCAPGDCAVRGLATSAWWLSLSVSCPDCMIAVRS